jgi:gamma-glutamyltranspeptidase/glutathione hydrolase
MHSYSFLYNCKHTGRFGVMEKTDLQGYRAVYREPVVQTYRGHTMIGMPPPSSGGLALAQIFHWMEGYNVTDIAGGTDARWSGELVTRWIDAQNAAFADRNVYVGDADFVDVPVQGLLDRAYTDARREDLSDDYFVIPAPLDAGLPPGAADLRYAVAPPTNENGTTHASISDRDGSLVALTTTIEQGWGSGVVVPGRGFLLNNELTDFQDRGVGEDGLPYANRPEGGKRFRRTALGSDRDTLGGKRPRSSMTPTILLDSAGKPLMATGAPGGSTIIAGTANVVLQSIDLGIGEDRSFPSTDDEMAFLTDQPRVMSQNGATSTCELDLPSDVRRDAEARGCRFTYSSGIALVQSVVVVHPEEQDNGSVLFAGACDSKRQYQGEGVCKAAGLDSVEAV